MRFEAWVRNSQVTLLLTPVPYRCPSLLAPDALASARSFSYPTTLVMIPPTVPDMDRSVGLVRSAGFIYGADNNPDDTKMLHICRMLDINSVY